MASFGFLVLPSFRLALVLRLVIAVLAVPLITVCGYVGNEAFMARNEAVMARDDNIVSDLLLAAASNLAAERGLTHAALAAEATIMPPELQAIQNRRQATDSKAKDGLLLVRVGRDFTSRTRVIEAADLAMTKLVELRTKVDAELAKEKSHRDPAIAAAWIPTATTVVERVRDVRLARSVMATNSLRTLASLSELKDFAWVMSEFAGRERAAIGGRLSAGQGLTAEDLVRLSQYRGRVELAWSKIQFAREQSALTPDVINAINGVEREFFGTFPSVRRQVYEAPPGTAAMPLTEWVTASTKAINSIIALSEAIGRHTEAVAEQTRSGKNKSLLFFSGLALTACIVVLLSFHITGVRVVSPLAAVTARMSALASGDLSSGFQAPYKDEIGEMALALEVFRTNAMERQWLEERERASLEARSQRQDRIETATRHFDKMMLSLLARIKGSIEILHSSSESLSANAEQTQRQSAAVSAATEQATANVHTVSAAGTELSASIQEISRQVHHSAETARMASNEASEAIRRVSGLAEKTSKIGEIVSLINHISSQTNLLALNATIESARAGEAGKGFAVVANEVKHLAGQTGKATDDIAAQIAAVQAETRDVVATIDNISRTIGRINELATSVAGAVEQQGAATAEIARNVQQASEGTREVSSNINGVAQAAANTGKMAQGVFGAANELMAESTSLETEIRRFLDEVHAA